MADQHTQDTVAPFPATAAVATEVVRQRGGRPKFRGVVLPGRDRAALPLWSCAHSHASPGTALGCARDEVTRRAALAEARQPNGPRPGDNRFPEHYLAHYQDEAEALARELFVSARGGLPSQGGIAGPPPDAGLIARIRDAVAAAHRDGAREAWAERYYEDQEDADRRHKAGY